jgi:hypothetical protein
LRYTHLRTHLTAQELLTPQQVAQYNALRGYAAKAGENAGHADHAHQPVESARTPRQGQGFREQNSNK